MLAFVSPPLCSTKKISGDEASSFHEISSTEINVHIPPLCNVLRSIIFTNNTSVCIFPKAFPSSTVNETGIIVPYYNVNEIGTTIYCYKRTVKLIAMKRTTIAFIVLACLGYLSANELPHLHVNFKPHIKQFSSTYK